LWERCCAQAREAGVERPLLRSREQFRELYNRRSRSYSKASLKVQTGSRAVETIAAEIANMLGLRKIELRTEQGEVE
jgi:shikimate kinase